jgi:hypothetical protein
MAAKNTLDDLRDRLFDTIDRLKESDKPELEVNRARAICTVAQTIINATKVEVEHLKVTDDRMLYSSFIQPASKAAGALPQANRPALPVSRDNGHAVPQKGLATGKDLGAKN